MRVTSTIISLLSLAVAVSAAEQLKLKFPAEVMTSDTTRNVIVSDSSRTLGHYGPPPNGCEKDEMAFQIQGIPGGM